MKLILRTYYCDDCGHSFKSFEQEVECPSCAGEGRPPTPPARSDLPVATAIMGERTKVQDGITRSMMAEHSMTDMRDGQRQGDIAAPPLQGSAAQMLKMAGGSMWRSPGQVATQIAQVGGNSGVPKDTGIKAVQNIAKRMEGR